jgi:hypothetical protein
MGNKGKLILDLCGGIAGYYPGWVCGRVFQG